MQKVLVNYIKIEECRPTFSNTTNFEKKEHNLMFDKAGIFFLFTPSSIRTLGHNKQKFLSNKSLTI